MNELNKYTICDIFLSKISALVAVLLVLLIVPIQSQIPDTKFSKDENDKSVVKDTIPPFISPFIQGGDGTVESTVKDMPDDDQIRSNLGGIYLIPPQNYSFSYDSIIPGETRSTKFKFTVIDKFSNGAVDVDFKDWAGNTTSLSIRYNAPKFRITPLTQSFGEVVTGQKLFTEFLIINESYEHSFLLREVKLKYGDRGFKIIHKQDPGYLGNLPKLFNPRDSLLVQIEFEATEEGNFSDSIGIGNGYVFAYKSLISAKVLSPIIVAEDYNFFDVTNGDTVYKQLSVKNTSSKVDLILTGYSAVRHPFRTSLPQITETEPMVLKPGFQLNFFIYFTPDSIMAYEDSVVFSSNATVKDHICRLYGNSVKPGLLATSFDWGRKRIDRPDRPELPPVNPYTNFDRAIWIENTTEDTIEIYEVELIDIEKGYAFEYSQDAFPRLLAPREPKYVQISFHPIEVGYHEVKLKFNTSLGEDKISTFQGIGIAPKVTTTDVNFDTTLVGDYLTPKTRKVTISNERWEFEDMLEIKSLLIGPNGTEISDEVAETSTTWGTEGFKIFAKNRNQMPIILYPGETIEYEINFSAQHEGDAYAEIITFSDALKDTVCKLTGHGLFYGLKPFTESALICVDDSDTITCILEHYGYDDIKVDSMRIFGDQNFYLVEPELADGFVVLVGERKEIKLIYNPKVIDSDSAKLFVYYNVADQIKETVLKLYGKSFHTDRTFTSYLIDETELYGLDKEVKVRIMLDFGEDIAFYRIGDLAVRLEFDSNILRFESVERGALLNGKFFNPKTDEIIIDNEKGVVTFPFKSISDLYLSGDGELFNLTFKTKKPFLADTIYKSEIKSFISTVGNHCVDFINSNDIEIEIDKSLTDYLNWLDFNAETNQLLDVRPNPSEKDNPRALFEIAQDGVYQMKIYDFMGKDVVELFNQYLSAGNYEVIIPILNLPSGLYYCHLKNHKFSATKKFIYIK